MKLLPLIHSSLITQSKKKNVKQSDILFVGDMNSLRTLYDHSFDNEYFHEMKKELKKQKKKYEEILFVGDKARHLKKISKDTIPFESFTNLEALCNLKQKKELTAYIELFGYPKHYTHLLSFFYNIAKNILEKIQPKVIILTCSYTAKYALLVAAKEMGITVIELQHGSITKDSRQLVRGRNYVIADYFITNSDQEKKMLTEKSKFNPEQVVSLGCPRYDFLKTYTTNTNRFREKHKIPANKKILFLPSGTDSRFTIANNENEVNADCTFSTLQKNKDWFLLIKLNAKENHKKISSFYHAIAKKYGITQYKIVSANEESTYDCIKAANATIVKHSTVGMESIIMGVPVINFELKKSSALTMFKEIKTNLIIKKQDDLHRFLSLVNDKDYLKIFKQEQKKYIQKHFTNFGKATQAILTNKQLNIQEKR